MDAEPSSSTPSPARASITTKSTVTAIAAAVGYNDPNQLARVVRQKTGLSPLQHRRVRGT